MYYQSQILPLDHQGNFLIAIHFSEHSIGGECTRESEHAYFAYGNLECPEKLTDITSLCCIPRPPCHKESQHFNKLLQMRSDPSKQNEHDYQYAYQAELAAKPALFVPRRVLASNNGIVLVGIERKSDDHFTPPVAVQGIIDVLSEKILKQHDEDSWPEAHRLARPRAISRDGQSVIGVDVSHHPVACPVEFGVIDRQKIRSYSDIFPIANFFAIRDGWIAEENGFLYKFDARNVQSKVVFKIPVGLSGSTIDAAINADVLVLSGSKGLVSVLDIATGAFKKYYPHRGCRRDDSVVVKISPDGQWVASKVHAKSELMITSLTLGKSWKIADIQDQEVVEKQEGTYCSKSHIPATFAFIQDTLLVFEAGVLRVFAIKAPADERLMHISEQGRAGARIPLKINPKSTFDKILQEAKLQRCSEDIQNFYSPACKLKSKKIKKNGWAMPNQSGAPILGSSRFGGWPDLPEGSTWPRWEGRPMSFLGQINLAEACLAQPEIRLPKAGVLLFFIGCSDDSYQSKYFDRENYGVDIMLGSNANQKKAWQVMYAAPDQQLTRTTLAEEIFPQLFAPCTLKIVKGGSSLPDERTIAYDCIAFNNDERESFNEVLDLVGDEHMENQLSGYPCLIQSIPPELACTLASQHDINDVFPDSDTDEYKKLTEQASELGLLIQLTSDCNPDFIWGDAGHLYFYGNRKEMEQGVFESCWIYYEN